LFNGLALVAVGCLTLGLVVVDRTGFFFVPVIALIVAVLTIGVTIKRAKSTTYAVFDYGVYKEQHLPCKLSVLAFSKIAEVTVSYGFLGRLFRFGTVTIYSACVSCSNLVLTGVKCPEVLRRVILAAKENPQ
jgi:membrane protein YdbS with pleckstrin-like domain